MDKGGHGEISQVTERHSDARTGVVEVESGHLSKAEMHNLLMGWTGGQLQYWVRKRKLPFLRQKEQRSQRLWGTIQEFGFGCVKCWGDAS